MAKPTIKELMFNNGIQRSDVHKRHKLELFLLNHGLNQDEINPCQFSLVIDSIIIEVTIETSEVIVDIDNYNNETDMTFNYEFKQFNNYEELESKLYTDIALYIQEECKND